MTFFFSFLIFKVKRGFDKIEQANASISVATPFGVMHELYIGNNIHRGLAK